MSVGSVVGTVKLVGCAAVALCVAAIAAPVAVADLDDTTLVSRMTGAGGAGANGGSSQVSVSSDGRYVAFESNADNLSALDNDGVDETDPATDIFVRDTVANTTTLISRVTGATGVGGDAISFNPAISGNGRYVAFASDADNLSLEDNDEVTDVFVRDTDTNETELVSRASGAGGVVGDDVSTFPSVANDGKVAFASDAQNLHPADTEAPVSVYVRDTVANTTALVSRESGASGDNANEVASFPSISVDGGWVSFQSDATNLSDADQDATRDVFERNLAPPFTTTYVSRADGAGGAGGDDFSFHSAISQGGRYVVFESDADNLTLDGDDGVTDVFVRDTLEGTTTLVSRATGANGEVGGGSSGSLGLPSGTAISGNGRYVAFHSLAANLDLADGNGVQDVFVRDMQAGTTTLVSRESGAAGAVGNDLSGLPSISSDGRFVGFESSADNFSAEADNGFTNIFLRDVLGPPDTDPPETIYADGPAEGETVPEGSVSFQFVSDEPGSTFEARITPGSDWQAATSPLTVDLTAGSYTFEVRAIDPAGNVDPTPTTVNFVVGEEGGPPPPPPGGDDDPPDVELSADSKQKLGKRIKLEVSCDEACSVAADGTVKAKGKRKKGKRAKTLELREVEAEIDADRSATLKLGASDSVQRKLRRSKKGTATITVTATDEADNSTEQKLKVRLR